MSKFNVNTINSISLNLNPISDQLLLNSFWSEYETKSIINSINVEGNVSLNNVSFLEGNKYFSYLNVSILSGNLNLENKSYSKFSSNTSILDTYKGLMVMENAIGKVFRSAFDEGRSNVNFKDFSKIHNKLPFLTSNLPNFKRLLHKNNTNFLNTNLYFSKYKLPLNNNQITNVSVNYFTFEFPFFVAFENDSIRYS